MCRFHCFTPFSADRGLHSLHAPGTLILPPVLTDTDTRQSEVRALVNYKIWHDPKRDITNPEEFSTSAYDRPSMRRCWEFLDQTSRSFSMVIKELDGDLARTARPYVELLSKS